MMNRDKLNFQIPKLLLQKIRDLKESMLKVCISKVALIAFKPLQMLELLT